ncbi:MAG: HDOD domain-containing protein, partial [Planctomycetota bacterium]
MTKSLFPLIAKRIDSIPTLPLALAALSAATEGEERSASEVARLVESDPALTAKVLKVINSPFYGLSCKISTLAHAIAMLGVPAIRKLAAGIASFGEVQSEAAALDKPRFWQHSLAVATAARTIAKEVGYDLPEEAFIGGLLHDVGKLVIDVYAPDEYTRLLEDAGDDPTEMAAAERRALEMDHAQVGSLVAEQWNLPKVLKAAIQFHHEAPDRLGGAPGKHRELVGIVGSADRLCWAHGLGPEGNGSGPTDPQSVVEGSGLSKEQVQRVLEEIEREFARTAESLGLEPGPASTFLERLREANDLAEVS